MRAEGRTLKASHGGLGTGILQNRSDGLKRDLGLRDDGLLVGLFHINLAAGSHPPATLVNW